MDGNIEPLLRPKGEWPKGGYSVPPFDAACFLELETPELWILVRKGLLRAFRLRRGDDGIRFLYGDLAGIGSPGSSRSRGTADRGA